jgi:Zn-dependent protease
MRSWSIPAGRFFGVEVRIHLTYLFLLFFVWMTQSTQKTGPGPGRGLALVAIIFLSVILHELGRAIVALHSQMPIRSVILLPIGGIPIMEDSPFGGQRPQPEREIRVAMSGPLVNAVIALAAGTILIAVAPELGLWTRPWVHAGHLMRSLVWVNAFLAFINWLPAYPLDGGRVLRAVLARRMDYLHATRRAVTVGQVFAMLFIFAGIWNTWLMMAGFFLFVAAQLEERTVEFQSVLENVRMEDVMLTEFSTLSPADTLEHALSKAVHTLQDDFPVIRGNDMVGVISRQRILDALRLDGNAYVQSVMNRAYEVANRTESLGSAFRKITKRGLNIIPVVEGEHLVGIVTLQNLMHSMSMLAESKKLRRALKEQ